MMTKRPHFYDAVSGFLSLLLLLVISSSIYPQIANAENDWRKRTSLDAGASTEDVSAEIDFGREVGARILGKYPLHEDKQIMKYITLVGRTITQNTNRPEIEFHFAVITTDEINAYAAPGGYVFVTKGALALMKDEAELAGVLAHEITHITEKHIVKDLNIKGTADSPAAGFARLIGGASESARMAFSQAADKAVDMLFKDGYKREDEVRADRGAALLMTLSGFDPTAFARYLDRIARNKSKTTEILDKTHPSYDSRITLITGMIAGEGIDPSGLKTNQARFADNMKTLK